MRTFFINIILLLLFFALLFWGISCGLQKYTRQGESITVADFRGMTVEQLDDYIKNKPLRYKIVDSTYVNGKLPGTIIEQNPEPDAKVKRNRRVYLTINAKVPPKTKMPDLLDSSLKNAKIQLENNGLLLGNTTYQPCIGKNTVAEVSMNGETVKAGDEIFKGSKIDLILCDGIGNKPIEIPDLVGFTFVEAVTVLRLSELSTGAVILSDDLDYKEAGYVYKQNPPATGYNTIKIGEPVDLFLQRDPIVLGEESFDFDIDDSNPNGVNGTIIDFNNPNGVPREAGFNSFQNETIEDAGEEIDPDQIIDFNNLQNAPDAIKKKNTQPAAAGQNDTIE